MFPPWLRLAQEQPAEWEAWQSCSAIQGSTDWSRRAAPGKLVTRLRSWLQGRASFLELAGYWLNTAFHDQLNTKRTFVLRKHSG